MWCDVMSALVSSRLDHVPGKFHLVRCSFEAYKSPSARPDYRMRWQESLSISVHTLLHSHPLHYSKTSTGYPLNGEYISNWPPWNIRHCTLASHLTCPNCYNIMNPHRLCDLPFFQLSVPRHNLEFGSRAFRISAQKIWNFLPASIRNSPSIPTFRWHLKTHYFQSAYANPNDHPLPTHPDSL